MAACASGHGVSGAGAHSPNEYCVLDGMTTAMKVLAALILEWSGVSWAASIHTFLPKILRRFDSIEHLVKASKNSVHKIIISLS